MEEHEIRKIEKRAYGEIGKQEGMKAGKYADM